MIPSNLKKTPFFICNSLLSSCSAKPKCSISLQLLPFGFARPTDPENTSHSAIVGSMLVHRLRRWPNIEPTMVQCLVFGEGEV